MGAAQDDNNEVKKKHNADEGEDDDDIDGAIDADDEKQVAELEKHKEVFHSQQVITEMQNQFGGLIPRTKFRTKTSLFSPLSFYHILYFAMSILGESVHFLPAVIMVKSGFPLETDHENLTLGCTTLAGFVYFGYAFSFHLLHVIIGNQTLTRTIQAVTKNGDTLLQVFGLMVIFIYIYALLAFALLRRELDDQEGMYCQTLAQCFTTSIRFGLLSGGGLGEAIPAENYGYAYPATKSMLFDLTFFILISTIGLNVQLSLPSTMRSLPILRLWPNRTTHRECPAFPGRIWYYC